MTHPQLSPGANARGAATPGPNLDALVAVMMGVAPTVYYFHKYREPLPSDMWVTAVADLGERRESYPNYSSDWSAAALIVNWMHAQGDYAAMSYQTGNKPNREKLQWVASFRISGGWASADTLPMAVCLAALDGVQKLKDRRQV